VGTPERPRLAAARVQLLAALVNEPDGAWRLEHGGNAIFSSGGPSPVDRAQLKNYS